MVKLRCEIENGKLYEASASVVNKSENKYLRARYKSKQSAVKIPIAVYGMAYNKIYGEAFVILLFGVRLLDYLAII